MAHHNAVILNSAVILTKVRIQKRQAFALEAMDPDFRQDDARAAPRRIPSPPRPIPYSPLPIPA